MVGTKLLTLGALATLVYARVAPPSERTLLVRQEDEENDNDGEDGNDNEDSDNNSNNNNNNNSNSNEEDGGNTVCGRSSPSFNPLNPKRRHSSCSRS